MATSDATPNHKVSNPLVTRSFGDLPRQLFLLLILLFFPLCFYCWYDARSPYDWWKI